MQREGHLGAALVAYAPVGFVTAFAGFVDAAYLGTGLAVVLAMLPDVDVKIPLVSHRGYTHTVWFALLVGVTCGAVGFSVGRPGGPQSSAWVAAFGTVVGTATICSHVAVDALTPMGVRPFAPCGERYSLHLVRASNPAANLVLLVVGVVALVGSLSLAVRLG